MRPRQMGSTPQAASAAPENTPTTHMRRGGARRLLRSLVRSPSGMMGAVIVVFYIAVAVLGPQAAPHDARTPNLQARFQAPGHVDAMGNRYVLGTDQLGRDILSRIIVGSRVSVAIGVLAAAIAGTIGLAYGIASGFIGGKIDMVLMRFVDAMLAIPFIVLVAALSGILGPGFSTLVLVLGLTGWVFHARVIRSETLVLREVEYVMAARAAGQRPVMVMILHVMPNVAATAIVLAAIQVGQIILAESALSFLGLGIQPPTITWGLMLADGRQYMGSAWWMTTFPGIAITVAVLGVIFLGDWLRDHFDPRLSASA